MQWKPSWFGGGRLSEILCLIVMWLGLWNGGCVGVGASSSRGGTLPSVSITSPATGSTVSGTVVISSSVNAGVVAVQFLLDGANLGGEVTSAPFNFSWNTTSLPDGSHTLSARARDAAGKTAMALAVLVTVNNASPSLVISSVASSNITSNAATITWSTNKPSDSQVEYGLTAAYGSQTAVNPSPVSTHAVSLSGLSADTVYHYRVKSEDAQGNSAISGDLSFTTLSSQPPGSCGTAVTNAGLIIPEPNPLTPRPALLSQYKDPKLGGCIERVTGASIGSFSVNDYSNLQAWNANQSLVLVETPTVWEIRSATDFNLLHTFNPAGSNVPRALQWSANDRLAMYYVDFTNAQCSTAALMKYQLALGPPMTGTPLLVKCFPEYVELDKKATWNAGSNDGRYIALAGVKPGGDTTRCTSLCEVFVYDLVTNTKGATLAVPGGGPDQVGVDQAQISPSGNYVLLFVTGAGTGVWELGVKAYNRATMTFAGHVTWDELGHGDFIQDALGEEWFVHDGASASCLGFANHTMIKSKVPNGIVLDALGNCDGAATIAQAATVALLEMSWTLGTHTSARAPSAPFVLVSTYDAPRTAWAALQEEVLKLYLDSTPAAPHVERLAHTRSDDAWVGTNCATAGLAFWASPRATLSPDGTKALYSSSWDQNCFAESYLVSLVTGPPGTVPPTVAITSPTNGQSVSGVVTVSATASASVVGLQFRADGINTGSELTTPPYSYSLDTRAMSNGSHTLTAVVRNAAGKTATSAPVTITVNNPIDTTPPIISGVSATPNSNSAFIAWTTDKASDSQVDYGTSGSYGNSSALDTTMVVGHSVSISGLNASTLSHYRVKSRAAGGGLAVSGDFTFTTPPSGAGIPPGLGWFQVPNTKLLDVCPPFDPAIWGNEGCSAVIADWNSAIADTKRNRLIIWGGGHNAYYGNELYAFDLNTLKMSRLNNPSPPTSPAVCTTTLADGRPNSRHTYSSLTYIAHTDQMFAFGGSPACEAGGLTNDTWTLAVATLQWTSRDPHAGGTPGANPGVIAAYDPNTQKVFLHDTNDFWSYDFGTNTYTQLRTNAGIDYRMNGVIDPKRKLFFAMGSKLDPTGGVKVVSIAPGSNYQMWDWTVQVTGCDGLLNVGAPGEGGYPGLAYDPVQDLIVGWPNAGNTVYLFNPDTKSCTTKTFPGGPPNAASEGMFNPTHGHFRYFPAKGVFVVVNDANNNVFTLRLTPVQAPTVSVPAVSNVTDTSAIVTWTTSEPADSRVECGLFTPIGLQSSLDLTLVVNHTQTLNYLTPSTTYFCRANSREAGGQLLTSSQFTFTTVAAPGAN